MANTELLKTKIKESGLSMKFIAENTGILRETLYKRMQNPNFRASEIVALTKILNLSKEERDDIFLR